MCLHCDWIEEKSKKILDELEEELPAVLENIRIESPEFYQIIAGESSGDTLTHFKTATMRQLLSTMFKHVIERKKQDSISVLRLAQHMLSNCKPADHGWMTVVAEFAVVDNRPGLEDAQKKDQRLH